MRWSCHWVIGCVSVSFACAVAAGCGSEHPNPGAGSGSLGSVQQALKSPGEALSVLQAALSKNVDAVVKQLPKEDHARLANALAWYDEDPRALRATRGAGGQVTHVSSRFLAYDVAPGLPPVPSLERADAAIAAGGIVRALAGLHANETLKIVDSRGGPKGKRRFVLEQQHAGQRVHAAGGSFDLDAQGRLTRFDGFFVAAPNPPTKSLTDELSARAVAEQHLKKLGEPWTLGKLGVQASEAVVVNRLELAGKDDERHAFRFVFEIESVPSALREVIVDRSSKLVLSSEDQVEYLLPEDQVFRAVGAIGGGAFVTGELLWDGSQACPHVSAAPSGATPFERDLDEVKAALCEAEQLFAAVGSELGEPDSRFWMDSGEPGIRIGIGADPLLSVAMNSGGTMVFAEGVARAEVVGHELIHSTARQFRLGGGMEAAAIEEHLGDAFGLLLERRFAHRRENDCLMNDDPDSMATIGDQDLSTLPLSMPFRPCATSGFPRPWRNACHPRADNGGWCEGAQSYRDMAFNKYDAYGDVSSRPSTHIASHTNLGLGNRIVTSLLGEAGTTTPHSVRALTDATVTRLVLGTIASAGPQSDWAVYGATMIDAAVALASGTGMGEPERQARAALANADIWSVPSPILPRLATDAAPTEPAPAPNTRPAVATVQLTGAQTGKERTFVLYKPSSSSTSVEYVWRDEVIAGPESGVTGGWFGPCSLPEAVTTGSPAAAGGEHAAFVAWGEPTATPGENLLRGLALTADAASSVTQDSDNVCDFAWMNHDPIAERKIKGSPALAVWSASAELTICEALKQDFPGLSFPFRSLAAMGIYVPDCLDVAEPWPGTPPKLIPDLGKYLVDLLAKELDMPPTLRVPQPVDPWAPRLPDFDPLHAARLDLGSLLHDDQDAQQGLAKLPLLGKRFSEVFAGKHLANRPGVEAVIRQKVGFDKDDFPQGTIQSIDLRFFDDLLVVAFIDEDGKLRATTWTDIAPTSEIALLNEAPNTEPALTQARGLTLDPKVGRVEVDMLYAVYGTKENVAGVDRPRVSYRLATRFDRDAGGLRNTDFSSERRMDDFVSTVGLRRQRDYRFLQTNQTPVAAGGDRRLHLFTVARNLTAEQPDDSVTGNLSSFSDHVRYTVFGVLPEGVLTPLSERPVLLSKSRLTRSVANAEAGAAIGNTTRRRVRWYHPNGAGIDVRSEGEL